MAETKMGSTAAHAELGKQRERERLAAEAELSAQARLRKQESIIEKHERKIDRRVGGSVAFERNRSTYEETKRDLADARVYYNNAKEEYKRALKSGSSEALKKARENLRKTGKDWLNAKEVKSVGKQVYHKKHCWFKRSAKHVWRNKWRYAALAGALTVGGIVTAASFGAFAPAAVAAGAGTVAPVAPTIVPKIIGIGGMMV